MVTLVEDASCPRTTLVVLAGGLSSRMQSLHAERRHGQSLDKALIRIDGTSLLQRTLERLKDNTFVARAVSSNADPEICRELARTLQLDVFSDGMGEHKKHLGPLAGILAAMRWSEKKQATWLLTVPCDCPFLPKDLWQKLQRRQKSTGADIVCGESFGRRHPVVALWRVALKNSLQQALHEGVRKIDQWTQQHHTQSQAWQQNPDPFFNINRPEDLVQAQAMMRSRA